MTSKEKSRKEPVVLESNQNHATITSTGICPTLSASMGMGGGYVPMIVQENGNMSRICDCCETEMQSGYVIADGLEYYCSYDCLSRAYSDEGYDQLCQDGLAYWTEWED